jgi:CheY-like chemotaxis protein
MHGGSVSASSDGAGRGSTFVVRLPRSATKAVSRAAASQAASPDSRRILVVEDNNDVADLLAEALRGIGHEVAVARDGEAAIVEVARHAPEAVLVDIGLPGIDGYELARRLRERPPPSGERMLLVAVTGYGSEGDRTRAREAGFDHHLVKPVRLEQLTQLLGQIARSQDGP